MRRTVAVALAIPVLAGCGGTAQRVTGAAPPGPGDLPAVQLDAVDRAPDPLDQWARVRAARYGIPARALRAYGQAAVAMAKAQPACHLGWTTLAGIARVESDHGRFGGSSVGADGVVRPPIRGVALDGGGGNALILDARRTGSARAMGPFQFIPDTWQRWGTRGSPDDIDDAALTAGRYLCAAGGDLATAHGWRAAVFAYNHSIVYVEQVRSAAIGYDA